MFKLPAVVVDGLLAVGAVALAFLVSLCLSPALVREHVAAQGLHHRPGAVSTAVRHGGPCSGWPGIAAKVDAAEAGVAAFAPRCRPAL